MNGHGLCGLHFLPRRNMDLLMERSNNQLRMHRKSKIGGRLIQCWFLGCLIPLNPDFDQPSHTWRSWKICGMISVRYFQLAMDHGCNSWDLENCKQNGQAIVTYYGQLKMIWDELNNYDKIPVCNCVGCKCNLTIVLENKHEEERVH